MRNRRILLAFTVLTVAVATVGSVVAYGLYYRSDHYRRHLEQSLTRFFGLPTDVQAVRPYTLKSRVLWQVQMWLPERRARIFSCPRAVWDAAPNETGGTVLHLYDAVLAIGSEAWKSEDYMRVLRASLLHKFSDLNIRQVRFHNTSLTWPRRDFQLRADGVDGRVDFDQQGKGQATLTSQSFNGISVSEPIRIFARIDPANPEDFLPEMILNVPSLPLAALGLQQVLGSEISQGTFAGKITLRQMRGGDTVQLEGFAQKVRLEEFTRRIQGGPVCGLMDLTIHRAVFRNHLPSSQGGTEGGSIALDELRFNAEVWDVNVDPLLMRFGLPAIGGRVNLQAYNGWLQNDSIASLGLSGQWRGGSLAVLSKLALGSTSVPGEVSVRIKSLVIQKDQLTSGDIDVHARPPADKPGTISRKVLLDVLEKNLGFALPPLLTRMLPESVEFVRAEAKLLIEGQKLQILPILETNDSALLTIRIGGQELPLIRNVDHVFDLAPLIERARKQAKAWQETLRKRHAASHPAG